VACRLKARISELERTSVARQRLGNHVSYTTVSECLKAGIVDSIRKRNFLGNGQRRFHCNDIGKQLFSQQRTQTFPAKRRCFRERINSDFQDGVLYPVGRTLLRGWLTEIRTTPRGGGFEYLHCSPAGHRRQQKGNPVPGGLTGPACSWEL
jgi:hypothetical protein